MLKLNIAGAGKLGRTLGRLWTQHAVFEVQDVLTAHPASAAAAIEFIGAGRAAEAAAAMRPAPVWMLTPPDSRIAEVCQSLAAARLIAPGDIVFHCSGSQAASELAAAARLGAHTASVHPVKSAADPARAAETFAGTWCGAEGDAAALGVVKPAFSAIGARLFDIDARSKTIYHAASVIACNYLAALIETGARCYEKAGLDRQTALQVMEPLMRETLDNVFRLGTAAALTGPIARGDSAVVARQVEALAQWNPQVAGIYRALGAAALDLARTQGTAGDEAYAAIARALSASDGST
jgi:predicted short-subunit dehydrogenase-like oxidoreductase (DUF2520 family)